MGRATVVGAIGAGWYVVTLDTGEQATIPCADFTDDIPPGTLVGTIEVYRNTDSVRDRYIKPGRCSWQNTRYRPSDGLVIDARRISPASALLACMTLPGAKVWRPLFGYGVVLAVSGEMLYVVGGGAGNGAFTRWLPAQYMSKDAAAFGSGDQVIVQFTAGQPLRVIGFRDGPEQDTPNSDDKTCGTPCAGEPDCECCQDPSSEGCAEFCADNPTHPTCLAISDPAAADATKVCSPCSPLRALVCEVQGTGTEGCTCIEKPGLALCQECCDGCAQGMTTACLECCKVNPLTEGCDWYPPEPYCPNRVPQGYYRPYSMPAWAWCAKVPSYPTRMAVFSPFVTATFNREVAFGHNEQEISAIGGTVVDGYSFGVSAVTLDRLNSTQRTINAFGGASLGGVAYDTINLTYTISTLPQDMTVSNDPVSAEVTLDAASETPICITVRKSEWIRNDNAYEGLLFDLIIDSTKITPFTFAQSGNIYSITPSAAPNATRHYFSLTIWAYALSGTAPDNDMAWTADSLAAYLEESVFPSAIRLMRINYREGFNIARLGGVGNIPDPRVPQWDTDANPELRYSGFTRRTLVFATNRIGSYSDLCASIYSTRHYLSAGVFAVKYRSQRWNFDGGINTTTNSCPSCN